MISGDLPMTMNPQSFPYNEDRACRCLKVATVTVSCDPHPAVNRSLILNRVNEIIESHPDTELVVFGEMILGWYNPEEMPEYHLKISERVSQEDIKDFVHIASHHGIYLCFGISEISEGILYNSQILLNPEGEIQAVHRKSNLKNSEIKAGYKAGEELVTITDIMGVKTGIVICSDAASPEIVLHLMRSNLDLIILSLADDRDEGQFMARLNARMYDAWIVTANRYGCENGRFWDGHMVISDPLGRLRVSGKGKEQYLTYELQFPAEQSRLKRLLRKIYTRFPLPVLALWNWKKIRAYF